MLRVTFPKIGDHERKQGVLPQRGHDSRDGKTIPGGGKGFGKFNRKPGYSKNRVHEVEQFEGQYDEGAREPEDYAQEDDLEDQTGDHDSEEEEEDAVESVSSGEEGEFLSEREAS